MKNYNILIVEDDSLTIQIITYHLKKADYNFLVAKKVQEAEEIIYNNIPDLIISDIMLPGIDGLEFCKKIRTNPKTQYIPFIFLTAKDHVIDRVEGISTGADDYIVKPFDPKELLARVDSKLKRIDALLQMSIIDPLTKAYNRKYVDENLCEILSTAKRYNRPLAIALVDVDNFKVVNDTYGHTAGDFVLQELVYFLKNNLRQADIVARYGGDEFIVIFPETSKYLAVNAVERIRKRLVAYTLHYQHNGEQIELKITASFGIAGLSNEDEEVLTIIKKADQALYSVKESGRNNVKLFHDEEGS